MSIVVVLSDIDRYQMEFKRYRLSIAEHGNDTPKVADWQRTPCAS
ncbi:hypothetical protein [Sphingomonas sp. UYP23]